MHLKILIYSLILVAFTFGACRKKNTEIPAQSITTIDTTQLDSMGKLNVEITGLKSTMGKVNLALYQDAGTFNKPDKAFRQVIAVPKGSSLVISIDQLPPGTYAFGLFHDENSNDVLDTNFLGIPKEGFAFSNNAMGSFGPPDFQSCSFSIPQKGIVTQSITLRFY